MQHNVHWRGIYHASYQTASTDDSWLHVAIPSIVRAAGHECVVPDNEIWDARGHMPTARETGYLLTLIWTAMLSDTKIVDFAGQLVPLSLSGAGA